MDRSVRWDTVDEDVTFVVCHQIITVLILAAGLCSLHRTCTEYAKANDINQAVWLFGSLMDDAIHTQVGDVDEVPMVIPPSRIEHSTYSIVSNKWSAGFLSFI